MTAQHLNPLLCNVCGKQQTRTKVNEQKESQHPALKIIVHQE